MKAQLTQWTTAHTFTNTVTHFGCTLYLSQMHLLFLTFMGYANVYQTDCFKKREKSNTQPPDLSLSRHIPVRLAARWL